MTVSNLTSNFMNITLINALLKIKNASCRGKELVFLDFNVQYLEILKIFYKEGFIQSLKQDHVNSRYIIQLRFFEQKRIINNIKFFSVPSFEHFNSFAELSLLNDKKLFILLSTNKGLLSLSQCKKLRLGGKLLFCIF